MRAFGIGILGIILAAIMTPAAWLCAADSAVSEWIGEADIPWELLANQVEYDSKNDVYIARGGVTIRKGNKTLQADKVTFDRNTMDATAHGHVILSTGDDLLTGEEVQVNLRDETGILYGGTIFTREKHFYIKGEKIEKIGKKAYKAYRASITTCDRDRPDWKITGRELDVTLEGYSTVRGATFQIRDLPVLYSPWALIPIKLKRQSGFLIPTLGNSDRKGMEWEQPFFWAINEQSDATLYGHYMSRRGLKAGAEYRYVLSEQSRGTIMFDYLDDAEIDDGSGTSSRDWGYEDDHYLRTNADRYWFRMKTDQALPAGFTGILDLDIVSDQDYLYEFKRGRSGFDESRDYYLREFGRELDDYTDNARTNTLRLKRTWPNYTLNAELLWYDDVIARRWEADDDTLQSLPQISLNSSKQRVFNLPLFWGVESEYTHFYRQDGARGNRLDLYPRLYLPYRFAPYLSVEPSVGLRETVWYVDQYDGMDPDESRWQLRQIPDLALDLSTDIYRVFAPDPDSTGLLARIGLWPEKIKHAIRPQLLYEYRPKQDQEDLPFFDILDRIQRRNRVTALLLNTLTSRSPAPNADETGAESYVYRQFLRFEVQQSYEFNTYETDPYASYRSDDRTDPEAGTHFSPLYGRLEIRPSRFYAFLGDAEWSHQSGRFKSNNLGLTLWDGRGDSLYTEYRYTRGNAESIYSRLQAKLSNRLLSYAEYERNIRDREQIKTALGMLYKAQCWSLDCHYIVDRDDHSFGVMVNLLGIGGFGSEG